MTRKIVIIDDSDDDRELYARLLRRGDHEAWEVSTAQTGDEGLALIAGKDVDVVLLDYQLPGHDGLHVLEAIRENGPRPGVVMMTGRGDESVAIEAMRLGAHVCLRKASLDEEILVKFLHNAIEHASLQSKILDQQAALRHFANTLAHDLRSPVRHIVTFGQYIQEALAEKRYEDLEEDVSFMVQGAERVQRLLEAITSFSGVGRPLQFEDVRLDRAVDEACSNLEDLLSDARARIDYEDLPVVHGNHGLIVQVLQNLITNSVTYCRDGEPHVRISGTTAEDGHCEVSVIDNGIGVPHDKVDIIFDPLRRLHTEKEFEGTGLGLYTCRKAVERQGGRIWCDPSAPSGTTMRFTIPMPTE